MFPKRFSKVNRTNTLTYSCQKRWWTARYQNESRPSLGQPSRLSDVPPLTTTKTTHTTFHIHMMSFYLFLEYKQIRKQTRCCYISTQTLKELSVVFRKLKNIQPKTFCNESPLITSVFLLRMDVRKTYAVNFDQFVINMSLI